MARVSTGPTHQGPEGRLGYCGKGLPSPIQTLKSACLCLQRWDEGVCHQWPAVFVCLGWFEFLVCFLFVWHWGSHLVQVGLPVTQDDLDSWSSSLHLPNAGITAMHYHACLGFPQPYPILIAVNSNLGPHTCKACVPHVAVGGWGGVCVFICFVF